MFARLDAGRLSLERDGADWPNRAASRMVEAGGLRWHVQIMGQGPTLLLLHGTGAAVHSWRDALPVLSRRYRVVAPDLPGHGFTRGAGSASLSLPGMARALSALLRTLDMTPDIAIGHSAGAAILARLCLDSRIAPRLLVSLNGAFTPFSGLAGHIFPQMAKLLFLNPLAPRFFAWSADRAAVARLLEGTGSRIDARGVELYARLLANPAHVGGALGMMANWDLHALARDLPGLTTRVALVVATNDRTVAPGAGRDLAPLLPRAALLEVDGLGHLAHEEAPARICDLFLNSMEDEASFRLIKSA
jgi:magnesium chelatase accessory protein